MLLHSSFFAPFFAIPPTRSGMRIGLLGGSFNPAHNGHVHITKQAIERLDLDAVWWLVSPHNPLKTRRDMSALSTRILSAWQATRDMPDVTVTAFEKSLRHTRTADALRYLVHAKPNVHFVWLMGEDNWQTIHTWGKWPLIFETMPVAVMPRKTRVLYKNPPAGQIFSHAVQSFTYNNQFAKSTAPAIALVRCPKIDISSTAIRETLRLKKPK